MSVSTFKLGDIVQLKSGSPTMTIETIKPNNDQTSNMVVCTWFHNTEVRRDTFAEASLKAYEPRSIF